jgi:hypothetical protein
VKDTGDVTVTPPLVTCTDCAPAVPAGVVAVMRLALVTLTFVAAAPPTRTVAPEAKFVPEMVSVVPPVVGPLVGEMAVTVGAAGGGVDGIT